ncbi:MAG TPA: tolB protein [Polyangiaceae bacterium]|jgi:TolB protein|nr:tolB protein [Polyangiaceae bacterium]
MQIARLLTRTWAIACAAALAIGTLASAARAQTGEEKPDESVLGELLITGDASEHITSLAILPSLSPDMEDVIVRSVVRRDFELTGLFNVIPDAKAPEGLYGFEDPVDIKAWSALGAEVIIKVAARANDANTVRMSGLCYFLSHGREPVYQKSFVVKKDQARVTAHRIADALLGAISGRNGGFSSHLTFAARAGRNPAIYTIDSDGHNIRAMTSADDTSVAPFWGPNGTLFYSRSHNYSPFRLVQLGGASPPGLNFKDSIYSAAFSADHKKLAVAVANAEGSSIWVGGADGRNMRKVSSSEVATHPVFSPSGKLAWIGGSVAHVGHRVYLDGKAISPAGFSAAAPTFCDTEDGAFLIYAVAVGNGHDLVMQPEAGGSLTRLTQNEGSNSYPACSPDGRLLAYFSKRSKDSGLYVKSLKSKKPAQKISSQSGESLRWAALPGGL